jgi:hypothetical protein
MACIVCKRDVGDSTLHRECLMVLFKEKKIKGIADWIRLSSKPRTILKGRVVRLRERATNAGTPYEAT